MMNAKLAFALLSLSAVQTAVAGPFDYESHLLTDAFAASNPRVGFVAPRHVEVGRRGYGKKCYPPLPVYSKFGPGIGESGNSAAPTQPGGGNPPVDTGNGGQPTRPGNPYVPPAAEKKCKYIPSDPQWPTEEDWDGLRSALTAPEKLIKTVPIGSVCYEGAYYNATRCEEITAQWGDSDLHDQHPSSVMSPFFTGNTCLPTSSPTSSKCTLGGYPVYAVDATTVRDVQAAVNFARNSNIRLVIKNTGHDFSGKSAGAHSVSVWTHNFRGIEYIEKWNGNDGYEGPAFKVGAGVQGREVYEFGRELGLMVVGGEGMTVGYAGGYLQGGGHSPLSSILGMGSDHVLEYNVVTPDGRFVKANKHLNADLFWALRGGGGSTWGVATSVVVRAHKTVPVSTLSFTFSTTNNDDFWSIIKAYMSTFNAFADAGCYSYVAIFFPGTFFFNPGVFCPNNTPAQLESIFQPVYDQMAAVNVTADGKVLKHFTNFYDAWAHAFPKEPIGGWTGQAASRLFPRENFANPSTNPLFDRTVSAIRSVVEKYNFFIGFNQAPKNFLKEDTSVNPAWRTTNLHAITTAQWTLNNTKEEVEAIRKELTEVEMKKWRDVSPGSGAYLGESDINEIDFQHSFWGNNYERLYELKQKYDPAGVFYAATAVGSEDWHVDDAGRLCPKA